MEAGVIERSAAVQIVDSLPDSPYVVDRQPTYPDRDAVIDAVHEVQETEGTTTPRHIDGVQEKFTEIVTGESDEFVVITGRCAQPVELETKVNSLVRQRIQAAKICVKALKKRVYAMRRECDSKPRSADIEILKSGETATPFMGEAINGQESHKRTPDPSRMVSSAVQNRDITAGLEEAGYDIPVAREALLLPFEQASKRIDLETGKTYLVSADMPWVGERTRDPDGEHVKLLSDVENPVGVKLGAKTTPEQIRKYQERLNPDNKPGKLVLMIRMGLEEGEAMARTLAAIKEYAPNALLLYDIHGSTTTNEHGEKIRQVSKIIQGIHETAVACKEAGLKLHGIHLETTMEDREECTDFEGQRPKHEGGVDPQLNRRQTTYLLGAIAGDEVLDLAA